MTDDRAAAAILHMFAAIGLQRDAAVTARTAPDDGAAWLALIEEGDRHIDAARAILAGEVPPEPESQPFTVPVFGAPEGGGVVFDDD
jgi:hypothetical protein